MQFFFVTLSQSHLKHSFDLPCMKALFNTKVEVVHHSPEILIFHNIVSPKELEEIKTLAKPLVGWLFKNILINQEIIL